MAEDPKKPAPPKKPQASPKPGRPAPKPPEGPGFTFDEHSRFWIFLVAVAVIGFAFRINSCDERRIASSVLEDPRISELIPRNDDLARRLEALDQLPSMASKVDQVSTRQDQTLTELRATKAMLQQVIDHSWTRTYSYDPAKEEEPSAAMLASLLGAVRAGAEVMVVHGPADGGGRLVSTHCFGLTIDTSENVICMGTVVPANMELPDGRRYQETLRHDGTISFSHWNADGSNVQGASQPEKRESTWYVRRPF
jgi:hypothetical protein